MKAKKLLLSLFSVICIGFSAFVITSCGESSASNNEEPPHIHKWTEINRTNATCIEDGIINYLCPECEERQDVVIEKAKGHNCVDYVCSECGHKFYTEGLEYELSEDKTSYSVTGIGAAIDTDIIIPSIYNDKPVRAIDANAFWNCKSLTNIKIPNSVTSIGYAAFYMCESLTNITIPDSVISIGAGAFGFCLSLTSIKIPDGVTSIDDDAFLECHSLTSVTIGNSVTSIGVNAFWNCKSLTNIEIPNNVTSIGYAAFAYCSSLKDVYYTGTEEQWHSITINNEYKGNDYLLNATIHYNHEG